jgi:hypothetical protein
MWIAAMKETLHSGEVILDPSHPVMARLQAEREAKCPCNRSREGWLRLLEEQRRAALAEVEAQLAAVVEASRRAGRCATNQ